MNILLNHTLRSIKANKGQFAVILITVTVVTIMLFVSLTIGDLFYNLNVALDSRLGSKTDITIIGDVFSEAKFNEFLKNNEDSIEYADTYLQIGALFKNQNSLDKTSKVVMVEATDTKTLAERYPSMLSVKEEYNYPYQYPAIWVGESFVKENSLKIGDEVEIYLEMFRSYEKMTITYIFKNEGIFANSTVNNIIIDYSSINAKGILNLANIKLKDDISYNEISKSLYEFMGNDKIQIMPSVNYAKVERVVKNNQTLLNVSLVFVIALMLFILFTSYLVIAKNRLNEMVVFKAVGATNFQTILIMLSEAVFYGIAGAVTGLILGRAGMELAVKMTIPNFTSAVSYHIGDYLLAFLMGIIISVAGAAAPIINTGKESIRELTSNNVKIAKDPPPFLLIITTILLISCVLLLIFVPKITIYITIILVIITALWILLIIPFIIKGLSAFFAMGKNSSRIASFSIKRNSLSRTLSAMVGSVITFSFIVVSIINVIIYAVTPYNNRFECDFVIECVDNGDIDSIYEKIKDINHISEAFVYKYVPCIWDTGTQMKDYKVYTVTSTAAIAGISDGVSKETLERFDSELRPVIVSYDLLQRFNLKIGQEIQITIGDKNRANGTLDSKFVVVGIDYAMTSTDRVMIIPEEGFTSGGKQIENYQSMLFINVKENVFQKDLYYEIRDKVEGEYCYILEFNNWAFATSVGIRGIMVLLNLLQFIVSIVALIGIINLTIVTFLSRKQEFAIYNCVGMDKTKHLGLVFGEGIIISLGGGFLALALSFIINRLIPSFALLIDRYVIYRYFPKTIPIIVCLAVILYTIIYISINLLNKSKYVFNRFLIK